MAATSSSACLHTLAPTAAPLPSISAALQDDAAWKDAAASYAQNKRLSQEQLALAKSSSPADILLFIEDTKKRQSQSKYAKVVKGVRACTETLKRHRKSLEFFAQAGGVPGCLAWGSIRVALQVVKAPLIIFPPISNSAFEKARNHWSPNTARQSSGPSRYQKSNFACSHTMGFC